MACCEMKYLSKSPQETLTLGLEIGNLLTEGHVVCLEGEMGGGKTALSQAMLRGLGVEGYITSPTYSIVNEYEAKGMKLYHFDIYRVESAEELYDIGFEEYLKNSIAIIEWPQIIREDLKEPVLDIVIIKTGNENERIINLKGPCPLIRELKKKLGERGKDI
ncbi:tRNA (adenosine(37)-N6)-threonylcarbamoyltransferase complex ATPase subunit type 1 TsaE [Alkalibacter saccharofermentans]|uniref:tRNA threonylcarbamoyladenosine biosynthesis protein TsaE n=1 Tax=Alkalibacter saccharofermentans DSM 14828 TaxID=1120975 RepID=A0A1M4VDB2_9FIRM|nr:tRNA (adenosine(37)-N6)-threonylcarbamoyltransferase complex ATPase subunit type 1 TsaE [Alkalibacter saccharofermentans]SHE66810.1 tRNA threonylcarbamoyladenosine biosynthesis protein TsaE [Alkalibacter saccharofermentans DSM 14828]